MTLHYITTNHESGDFKEIFSEFGLDLNKYGLEWSETMFLVIEIIKQKIFWCETSFFLTKTKYYRKKNKNKKYFLIFFWSNILTIRSWKIGWKSPDSCVSGCVDICRYQVFCLAPSDLEDMAISIMSFFFQKKWHFM